MPMRSSAASMQWFRRPPGRRPWHGQYDRGRARRAFPAAEYEKNRHSPPVPARARRTRLFERVRLMAQEALRRNDQHPLRAQGGEQDGRPAADRPAAKRRAHPFQRARKQKTAVWPAPRALQSPPGALQRHNRPLLRHALRAEATTCPLGAVRHRKTPCRSHNPDARSPICAAGKTFSRRPRLASFFHAQPAEGGRIERAEAPPHPRGLRGHAARSSRAS